MNKIATTPPVIREYNTNPFSLAFKALSDGFKRNQNPVIAILVGGFIMSMLQQIPNLVSNASTMFGDSNSSSSLQAGSAMVLFLFLGVAFIVSIFVQVVWQGFCVHVGLTNAQEKTATVKGSLNIALSKFFKLFAIQLIIGLISLAWLLPSFLAASIALIFLSIDQNVIATSGFVVAGILFAAGIFMSIRAQLSRSLAYYSLYDGKAGSYEAVRDSVVLTKGRLMEVFGLSFATAIVPFISVALNPLGFGAYYCQLKSYRTAGVQIPKTHILSWLPVIVIGCVFLLGLFIGLMVAALAINN